MNKLKGFLTRNTTLLKTARTLLQVLIGYGITKMTIILTGTPLPIEVQVAFTTFIATGCVAIMAEVGRILPGKAEDDNSEFVERLTPVILAEAERMLRDEISKKTDF